MYKVELERVYFDNENRIIRNEQFYTYFENLVDALDNCVIYLKVPAKIMDCNEYLYIWHDGGMIYHAECNDGVWS